MVERKLMHFISLDNSFVYLNPKENNSWRSSIKSILVNETDKTTHYLTKEWRAETVGESPFGIRAKQELCVVVDDKKILTK